MKSKINKVLCDDSWSEDFDRPGNFKPSKETKKELFKEVFIKTFLYPVAFFPGQVIHVLIIFCLLVLLGIVMNF